VTSGPPSADFYPDPGGSGRERYWDGERWTKQLRPGPQSAAMPQQQAWPPASTDCPQGAQVSGGNQYWQDQPPGQPPSGVSYPQPPQRRSTVRLWWFLAATFLAAIVLTLTIVLVESHSTYRPPTPRNEESYSLGYQDGDGLIHGEGGSAVAENATSNCQSSFQAESFGWPSTDPLNYDDYMKGCLDAIAGH
jgi:hypothetical protein